MSVLEKREERAGAGLPTPVLKVAFIAGERDKEQWCQGFAQAGIVCAGTTASDLNVLLIDERSPECADRLITTLAFHREQPPLVFFLVEGGKEPALAAMVPEGKYDFTHLPIQSAGLATRLKRVWQQFDESRQIRKRLDESTTVAVQSMSLNTELGRILQFMEHCLGCDSYEQVSRAVLQVLNEYGLRASVGIFHDRGLDFYSDDGSLRNVEQEIIETSRSLGQMYDFGARTIVNLNHIAILIRNMPVQDSARCEILKEHVYFLANAFQGRVAALIVEKRANDRANRIQTTVIILQQIISEMEEAKLLLTDRSSEELENILINLTSEFSTLSLTSNEEARLTSMLNDAGERVNDLFKASTEQDHNFRSLLSQLAETLKH